MRRMRKSGRAGRREATASLARRHPRAPGGPLDPRVDGRSVRPLRAGQPARAAGPLHRAPRPRRHRARLPGRPQRHHRLALADDDRDARRGQGGRLRPPPGRVLGPLAAQPAPDPRASRGPPPPGRRGPSHVRPADPQRPIPTTGTSSSPRRRRPSATAAGSRSGSPTATLPSSTSRTTLAAMPPLGFRRSPEPPHTLEIDPATIGTRRRPVRALRPRRSSARSSSRRRPGLETSRIRCILMNPLYNGWIRRHRGPNETRKPAPWRSNPPVSDELWARVEDVRRTKTPRRGPASPPSSRSAGRAARVRLRAAYQKRRRRCRPKATASSTLSPARGWGTQARLPARDLGGSHPRSAGRDRARRRGHRPGGRRVGLNSPIRSPSTVRGSSVRCASLPWNTSGAG